MILICPRQSPPILSGVTAEYQCVDYDISKVVHSHWSDSVGFSSMPKCPKDTTVNNKKNSRVSNNKKLSGIAAQNSYTY